MEESLKGVGKSDSPKTLKARTAQRLTADGISTAKSPGQGAEGLVHGVDTLLNPI